MSDETIVRMIEETSKILSRLEWMVPATHLLPTYSALLRAARENHPDDPFLGALPAFGSGTEEINAPQLNILFTQLRIALESFQRSARSVGAAGGEQGVP